MTSLMCRVSLFLSISSAVAEPAFKDTPVDLQASLNLVASECNHDSGTCANTEQTSLLQTTLHKSLGRSTASTASSPSMASNATHKKTPQGDTLTVFVISFNHDEDKVKAIDSQHAQIRARLQEHKDRLETEGVYPDVIVFASQELLNQAYKPLEANMLLLEGYEYGGNAAIVGQTTPILGAQLQTLVEFAIKTGTWPEQHITNIRAGPARIKRLYALGYKPTKGAVWQDVQMMRGAVPFSLRIMGVHLDTKEFLQNLHEIGRTIEEEDAALAVDLSENPMVTILTGDYNSRISKEYITQADCDSENMEGVRQKLSVMAIEAIDSQNPIMLRSLERQLLAKCSVQAPGNSCRQAHMHPDFRSSSADCGKYFKTSDLAKYSLRRENVVQCVPALIGNQCRAAQGGPQCVVTTQEAPQSPSQKMLELTGAGAGLRVLMDATGLSGSLPGPPTVEALGEKFFLPTYKLKNKAPGNIPPRDAAEFFDNLGQYMDRGRPATLLKKSKTCGAGLLDYSTVLFDDNHYQVGSGDLTWDYFQSDHAMTTNLVSISSVRFR